MFDMYTCIVTISVIFSIITIFDIMGNRLITKEMKVRTSLLCVLLIVTTICECLGVITDANTASPVILHKLCKLVEFSLSPAIAIVFAMVYGKVENHTFARTLVVSNIIVEFVGFHYDLIFSVDDMNVYRREDLYWIYIFMFSIASLYGFWCIGKQLKASQDNIGGGLVLSIVLFAFSVAVQMFYSDIRIIYLAVVICNFMFYNRQCRVLLQVDSLTALLNHRCYENHLGRLNCRSVILVFDICKFKQINDSYGHLEGDRYIKIVANIIRGTYKDFGTCYRIGGDEFCVIMDRKLECLEELTLAFNDKIKKLKTDDERMPNVAVGYAYYNEGVSNVTNTVADADDKMYANKAILNNEV